MSRQNKPIEKISYVPPWIMDGTSKTGPNVFYQLYTIHAPGRSEREREKKKKSIALKCIIAGFFHFYFVFYF